MNITILAVLAAAGCTSVTVSGSNGTVTCSGLVATDIRSSDAQIITVKASGLGVFSGPDEWTVGWFSGLRVYSPTNSDRCRVVLMPQHPEELGRFLKVLEDSGVRASEICTVQ